ncbi:MAG: radical SAM protein, partial [Methanoregulaceae archaeon]|nr:radical SAM protein [Methanoregulaceae archaeon]
RIEGTVKVPPGVRALGEKMYEVRDGGIETASWVLFEQGQAVGGERSIIERYPDRGIVVEVTPLP